MIIKTFLPSWVKNFEKFGESLFEAEKKNLKIKWTINQWNALTHWLNVVIWILRTIAKATTQKKLEQQDLEIIVDDLKPQALGLALQ